MKGLNEIEIGPDEYLCTYAKKTFIVKLQGNVWTVSEEQRNGSLKVLEGVHDSKQDAIDYYIQTFVHKTERKERIENRKGGSIEVKKWNWKEGDRVIVLLSGKYWLGTVIKVTNNWTIDVILDNRTMSDEFRGSFSGIHFNYDDERIIGRGPEKAREMAIPPSQLEKYLQPEGIEKTEFKISIEPNVDAPLEEVEKVYMKYIQDLKKFVNPKFYKIIYEFCRDHRVVIFNPSQSGPGGDVLGSYWSVTNDIKLRWENIKTCSQFSAQVTLHEVVHYKMHPVKTTFKNWAKKNIPALIGVNPNDPTIKKWLNLFCKPHYAMTVNKSSEYLAKEITWHMELNLVESTAILFLVQYGLSHFFELPSVIVGLIETGYRVPPKYKTIYVVLFKKFGKQLLK